MCIDGGVMHIATALGKTIVGLFGHFSVDQGLPWEMASVLLQKDRFQVAEYLFPKF